MDYGKLCFKLSDKKTKTMKKTLKIMLLLSAIAVACKKEDKAPSPAPFCVEAPRNFEGRYWVASPTKDTVEIVFVKSFCPDNENANKYLIKGLSYALRDMVITGGINLPDRDYEAHSDEKTMYLQLVGSPMKLGMEPGKKSVYVYSSQHKSTTWLHKIK